MALPIFLILTFHLAVAFWPYPNDPTQTAHDSTLLVDTAGHPLAEFAAPDGQWRITLAYADISPHLIDAITAVEDARFFDHRGVDWRAAAAALWQDATALRMKRGASTITMQLYRLRHPTPHTLAGKVAQAVRATQLERRSGKQDILVEYLNRAPFGGNLVGAGAASQRYFGRACRDLSLAQAALLAGLPKNPTADRPDRFPDRARARRDFVLDRMLALGRITPQAHALALAEPLDATWHALPQHDDPALRAALPTLANLVRQSPGGRIATTLDLPAQQLAATAARRHLDQQGDRVHEVAVLILDTESANCLAALSLSRGGRARNVDLTARPRSTGSVIKPFIYAAAFDAGIASPRTVLIDSPAAWPDGYAPANFDQQFRGPMTAAAALAESRNIPALRLLAQVGVPRAVGVCTAAGLHTLGRTPRRFGLPLAVGGAEATPREVAEAFATLARAGRHLPLRLLTESPPPAGPAPCLSRRACDDTLACLSDPARTAAVCREAAPLHPAWKTGTSSGHRDAWCAAVGPTKTVVVWTGNATGDGAKSLVGADAAAPLALQLLAAIDHPAPQRQAPPAPQLARAIQLPPRESVAILSPINQSVIVLDPDLPPHRQQLLFKAAPPAPTIQWFVDGAPVGASTADDPLWWPPQPGPHEIRAVDPTGNATQVQIRVAGPAQ